MTLTDSQRADAVRRLIKVATGDEYGDQEIVMNYGYGYAEGNQGWISNGTDMWVTGNWNDKTRYVDGNRETLSDIPSRLANALERIGVNPEWYDQNDPCSECYKLIETQPSSYDWQAQFVAAGDGYHCLECVMSDVDTYLDEYVNDESRAVTWIDVAGLAERGWRDAWPTEHNAENGWHPGQTDTPQAMVSRWQDEPGNAETDYVFVIVDPSQFYIGFRMMVRDSEIDA